MSELDDHAFWRARDVVIQGPIVERGDGSDSTAKYLPCKLRGHTFSHPAQDRQPDVVCQRCGAQRLQAFDDAGCVASRTYLFPPGYHPEPS